MKYNDYVKDFADMILSELRNGTAPWRKPWNATVWNIFEQLNSKTGASYKAGNVIRLLTEQSKKNYLTGEWMTFKQAQSLGARVRKGEHGVPCVHWSALTSTDENGASSTKMIPACFTVFNISQIDELPDEYLKNVREYGEKPSEKTWEDDKLAEQILSKSGAKIYYDGGDSAYYSPLTDDIHLPNREAFPTVQDFYDTALHELAHWTGPRLKREMAHRVDKVKYAREELRAEIASAMMCAKCGISHDFSNNNAYIASWIKAIENDPKEILKACSDADKIVKFLMGDIETAETAAK